MRYQKKAQEKEHKIGLELEKYNGQFLLGSSFREVTRLFKNCWTYFLLKLIPSRIKERETSIWKQTKENWMEKMFLLYLHPDS